MCNKLVQVLFNLGYLFYGQTPNRIKEVIEWYADMRSWKVWVYNQNLGEARPRDWEPEIDVPDTLDKALMKLYAIHSPEQWNDFLYVREMGWEEDWKRVHYDRSEGSGFHFHFLPTYILGKEQIPKATEKRTAAWWGQFHDLVMNLKDEGIPLHKYPSIIARANKLNCYTGRPDLLSYMRLVEHYESQGSPAWLLLLDNGNASLILKILKKHPKFEIYSSYLEENSTMFGGEHVKQDLEKILEAPKISPNPKSYPGVALIIQIALLAGRSPIQIVHQAVGGGWFSDNKVALRALRIGSRYIGSEDIIQYAMEHDPMFLELTDRVIAIGGYENIKPARRCKHGQVALWYLRKYIESPTKWTSWRVVHGPAGETRRYRYMDMLDEIEFEDLVNGLRTNVETVLEASSKRLEALYLAEMGENIELPVLKEVKETSVIKQIVYSKDLKEEGRVQHNCVGGYIRSCLQRRSYIYSTWDRMTDRLTIELISRGLKEFEIIQVKLANNASASKHSPAIKVINDWVMLNKKAGITINYNPASL
jgi:hypothetical protein